MKKSELKNIIKECVREVIFEEGALSGIVTEVAQGLMQSQTLSETLQPVRNSVQKPSLPRSAQRQDVISALAQNSYEEAKKKFKHPELFEGTKPIREGKAGSALSGMDPGDPGIDISSIPGMGNWAHIAKTERN